MGTPLDKLSPKVRAMVDVSMAGKPAGAPSAPASSPRVETRVSVAPTTVESMLNKTEAAFLARLRGEGHDYIGIQAHTLRLSHACRYTPDFITVRDGYVTAWEVKGFWRDDARVKIKQAAREFRWIKFIAVQHKRGAWIEEAIAP